MTRNRKLFRIGILIVAAAFSQGAERQIVPANKPVFLTAYSAVAGTAEGAPAKPTLEPVVPLSRDADGVITFKVGDTTHVQGPDGYVMSRTEAAEAIKELSAAVTASQTESSRTANNNPKVGQINPTLCLSAQLPRDMPTDNLPPPDVLRPPGGSLPTPPDSATRAPASVGGASSAGGTSGAGAPPPIVVQGPPVTASPPTVIEAPVPSDTINPGSPAPTQVIDTLSFSKDNADNVAGQNLAAAAEAGRLSMIARANADQRTLADAYRSMTNDELVSTFQRAQHDLNEAAQIFENAKQSSLESSEQARFRNVYLNAADKAQLALDSIKDSQKGDSELGELSPFRGLASARDTNPLARSQALADIFGPTIKTVDAATTDSLVNRVVMLNGLPKDQRKDVGSRLNLIEHPTFSMPDGSRVSIDLLHNGYILGGGATGIDCSSFVSAMLPADVRKGRFTSLDFRTMWIWARSRQFPNPPRYTQERAQLVKATSDAFIPIDIYGGDTLRIGDILVYRLPSDPIGHVVVVRNYNAVTLQTDIIEAAQSAGTIRERSINLSPDPLSSPKRLLMPGLYALRLKPVSNHACAYKDGARHPAASGGGGAAK